MNLSEYIADPIRRAELAHKCMTCPQWLYQIASGWRGKRASPRLAKDIERETGGVVTFASLRPDLCPSPQSQSEGAP